MERKIKLQAKDFSNFLRCLYEILGICNAADIRGGVLRQRSNNKLMLLEMNLIPLISDSDILISDLMKTLTSMGGLRDQEVQITITSDSICFSGQRSHSSFKFANPDPSFMTNTFIPTEEFDKMIICKEEDLILEHVVTKKISASLDRKCFKFKMGDFLVCFDGRVASITFSAPGKNYYSEIERGIPVKKSFKGIADVIAAPLFMDHDRNMVLRIYNYQKDMFINKFSTLIGKIPFNIYGRSRLIKLDDELEEEKRGKRRIK